MSSAFLCLGSNYPDASGFIGNAITLLCACPGCSLARASSIYLTEPQNLSNQPWFHNQVIKLTLDSGISTIHLMKTVLAIEKKLGRIRTPLRFGPRCIDIDILLIDRRVSNNQFCILPHPRMLERAFALLPLLEIEPEIRILDSPASTWLARLQWSCEGNKIFQ